MKSSQILAKTFLSKRALPAHISLNQFRKLFVRIVKDLLKEFKDCPYSPIKHILKNEQIKFVFIDGIPMAGAFMPQENLLYLNLEYNKHLPLSELYKVLKTDFRHELHHAAKSTLHGGKDGYQRLKDLTYSKGGLKISDFFCENLNPAVPVIPFNEATEREVQRSIVLGLRRAEAFAFNQKSLSATAIQTFEEAIQLYEPQRHRGSYQTTAKIGDHIVNYLWDLKKNITIYIASINPSNKFVEGFTVPNSKPLTKMDKASAFLYDSSFNLNLVNTSYVDYHTTERDAYMAQIPYPVYRTFFPELGKIHTDEFNNFNCDYFMLMKEHFPNRDNEYAPLIQFTCHERIQLQHAKSLGPEWVEFFSRNNDKIMKDFESEIQTKLKRIRAVKIGPILDDHEPLILEEPVVKSSEHVVESQKQNTSVDSDSFLSEIFSSPWYLHILVAAFAIVKEDLDANARIELDPKRKSNDLNVVGNTMKILVGTSHPDLLLTYEAAYSLKRSHRQISNEKYRKRIGDQYQHQNFTKKITLFLIFSATWGFRYSALARPIFILPLLVPLAAFQVLKMKEKDRKDKEDKREKRELEEQGSESRSRCQSIMAFANILWANFWDKTETFAYYAIPGGKTIVQNLRKLDQIREGVDNNGIKKAEEASPAPRSLVPKLQTKTAEVRTLERHPNPGVLTFYFDKVVRKATKMADISLECAARKLLGDVKIDKFIREETAAYKNRKTSAPLFLDS